MPRNAPDRELAVKVTVDSLQAAQELAKSATAFEGYNKVVVRVANSTNQAFRKIGAAWNAIAVAQKATGYLAMALAPAMELEAATARLGVATNKTGAELETLSRAAAQAAASTVFSPTEAIAGMEQLALSVTDTKAATEAILPVLTLAQTYFNKNVGVAVTNVSSLMRSFGIQGASMTKTLDEWVSIASTAGIKVNDMAAGFKKLGGAANLANANFSQMAPLLALTVKGGLPAREAATGLFVAMQNLSRPEAQAELKKTFGVIVESGGMLKDPRNIMLDLAAAIDTTTGMTNKQNDALRKAFGGRALLPIIRMITMLNQGVYVQGKGMLRNAEVFDAFASRAQEMQGILKEMADRAMEPLSSRIEQLQENFVRFMATVGAPVADRVKAVVVVLSEAVNGIEGFLKKNEGFWAGFANGIIGFGFKTAGNFAMMHIGMMAIAGALGVLRAGLAYAATAFSGFTYAGYQAAMAEAAFNRQAQLGALAADMQAKSLGRLAYAAKVVGITLKFVIGKLFYWFMIATMVYDLVQMLLPAIKKFAGIGEPSAVAKQTAREKEASKGKESKEAAIMKAFNEGTQQLGKASEKLEDTVEKWSETIKSKVPEPSTKVLGDTRTALTGILAGPVGKNMTEAGKARMMEDMKTLEDINARRMSALTTGIMPSAEDSKKASEIAQGFTSFLSGMPQFAKLQEQLGMTGQAFEASSKDKYAASVLEKYEYMKGNVAATQLVLTQQDLLQKAQALQTTKAQLTTDQQRLQILPTLIKAEEDRNSALIAQYEDIKASLSGGGWEMIKDVLQTEWKGLSPSDQFDPKMSRSRSGRQRAGGGLYAVGGELAFDKEGRPISTKKLQSLKNETASLKESVAKREQLAASLSKSILGGQGKTKQLESEIGKIMSTGGEGFIGEWGALVEEFTAIGGKSIADAVVLANERIKKEYPELYPTIPSATAPTPEGAGKKPTGEVTPPITKGKKPELKLQQTFNATLFFGEDQIKPILKKIMTKTEDKSDFGVGRFFE